MLDNATRQIRVKTQKGYRYEIMSSATSSQPFDDYFDDKQLRITVDAANVTILNSPSQFYSTLMQLISSSQRRILLSTLYIGTGHLEQQLIENIDIAMNKQKEAEFCVRILLDHSRGTRIEDGNNSSVTILQTLVDKYPDNLQVHLYHTPKLRGLLRLLLPGRVNEIIGVQHMKLCIIDDNLLITGSNLSNTYFTNRQDRYILIRNCPLLADFYAHIIDAVSSCSFLLQPNAIVNLDERCSIHPYAGDYNRFCRLINLRINNVIDKFANQSNTTDRQGDTIIYPMVQMGHFGIDTENRFVSRLLSCEDSDMSLTMATGYFNLTDEYVNLIANSGKYKMSILSACPKANGFYNGRGLSGYIPALYTNVTQRFLNCIQLAGRSVVNVYEFDRLNWTFHGKGIWSTSTSSNWYLTMIGSSNFGYRSVHRDLEAQLVIATKNAALKMQLNEERNRLFEWSTVVDSDTFRRIDHAVPFWLRYLSRFIRNFF